MDSWALNRVWQPAGVSYDIALLDARALKYSTHDAVPHLAYKIYSQRWLAHTIKLKPLKMKMNSTFVLLSRELCGNGVQVHLWVSLTCLKYSQSYAHNAHWVFLFYWYEGVSPRLWRKWPKRTCPRIQGPSKAPSKKAQLKQASPVQCSAFIYFTCTIKPKSDRD